MLPAFPAMSPLTSENRVFLGAVDTVRCPYACLWPTVLNAWDPTEETRIAELNGNVVYRMASHLTGSPCYSFLGTHKALHTTETLLIAAQKEGIPLELRVIPQEVIPHFPLAKFVVAEDRANSEYILDLHALSSYSGGPFEAKRRRTNKFWRSYDAQTEVLDLNSPATRHAIEDLYLSWERYKLDSGKSVARGGDSAAVMRYLTDSVRPHSIAVGLRVGSELVGFSVAEIARPGYAIILFVKANTWDFSGSFEVVMQCSAHELMRHGCMTANFGEDMGIPLLRDAKLRYRPIEFLRTYSVFDRVARIHQEGSVYEASRATASKSRTAAGWR